MNQGLSKYKFKRMAEESLRNTLRLHIDSIILFQYGSYPSAYQLSVLSLEEFAKAKWIDHYFYSSITNEGFPDAEFEQEWLKLLYLHPEKQFAFIGRELFDYSPKFVKFVRDGKLELRKQQSAYVGLERSKGKVKTNSRISVPSSKIKERDAKQIISLLNQEFLEVYNLIQRNDGYWGIWELDFVIDPDEHQVLFVWPHKSGLKSRKWRKTHHVVSS